MMAHPSDRVLVVLALSGALFVACLVHAGLHDGSPDAAAPVLVRQLGLSDLTLFTEARYTRHPSQADLHSAFQDHPMSLDHFPSGSLITPPRHFGPTGGFATSGQAGARP
jgi:hypothetical protein